MMQYYFTWKVSFGWDFYLYSYFGSLNPSVNTTLDFFLGYFSYTFDMVVK